MKTFSNRRLPSRKATELPMFEEEENMAGEGIGRCGVDRIIYCIQVGNSQKITIATTKVMKENFPELKDSSFHNVQYNLRLECILLEHQITKN